MTDPDEGLAYRILKIIPTNKLAVKLIWKCKGSRMAKIILEGKKQTEESHHLASRVTTKLQ